MLGTTGTVGTIDAAGTVGMTRVSVDVLFELPDHLSHVAYLRKQARRLFEWHSLAVEDIDDLEMILGELATNAARHGRSGTYQVHVNFDSTRVVITVTDTGNGFSPELILSPGTPRPDPLAPELEPRIGGFGLPLVKTLSHQMDITPNLPHGTRVYVAKNLKTVV